MRKLLLLGPLFWGLLSPSDGFQAICPSVCTCKWKNGKRWVECTNKQQISIPDSVDPETQVLDLGGNNLQILPREVFSRRGLINLQKLKLSDCNIGQIDPTAFRGLTNLVELDLSNNLLTAVPTPTFSDIPYLRELALNNNPLQKIEGHAFEMVSQIISLDISGCSIKKISARAFHQIEALEKLYLHNNKIEELKQRTVESVSRLHSLTLHDNPWTCDCHLRPLLHWLQVANLPMVDLPKCKEPKRLTGKRFTDIPIENFACPPDLLPTSRYVEANIGSNTSVVCRVSASPSATVRWLRDGQEIRNSSGVNRSRRKFLILESGHSEIVSRLVITQAEDKDGGQYMCVAENKAGHTEANFTLAVGYFGGSGPLEVGEVVGISITLLLLLLIVMVIIGVIILKLRPNVLRTEKLFQGRENGSSGESNGRSMEMNYTTVQNGASGVVIDGTMYTHVSNGIGATGYINPDVVPTLQSPEKGTLTKVKKKSMSAESEEVEQNRENGRTVSGLVQGNSIIESGEGRGRGRYENFPPPLSSLGTSTSLSPPGVLQPEELYSGSSLYSHNESFQSSPRLDQKLSHNLPASKDHLDNRLPQHLNTRTLDNRLSSHLDNRLPEHLDTRLHGHLDNMLPGHLDTRLLGGSHVNSSFTDEDLGNTGPLFQRDTQYQPRPGFQASPSGFRSLRFQGDRPYGPHLGTGTLPRDFSLPHPGSLSHTATLPRDFSIPNPASVAHTGTLPRDFRHSTGPSPSLAHSTPVRPDWEVSPVQPLYSRGSTPGYPLGGSLGTPGYPKDHGLPQGRRPEVHLAHNPLGALPEEWEEGGGYPGAQYSTGAIQALELLNQSTSGYPGFKSMLETSSQESSGRGSSSSGSSKVWSSCPATAAPLREGCSSARESPDEGIQTDSGTDV